VVLRFSQWKIGAFDAKIAATPQELERFLRPLVDAGVDVFHCSTRRFWEPEFEGSPLNLAGWTKKLTGKPTITVGSVTLGADLTTSFGSPDSVAVTGIDDLLDRLERGEFDLVAVGRALIANPAWAEKIRAGALDQLRPFDRGILSSLA
jgi:2,4-dienoyl-CoA reductase-like NADH-dependent reductase (Old Yellow Enzyme family)